ncbi:hypothetical protein HC757_01040 [Shewanella sp. SHSM-M6]|uniref:Uncharacterized protein n=2 Tax=Shewanella salipaludis TaxID=2723052 RepID=A0A972JJY5_9GAMM|nr:hypothetical protein [Shewanella salipaludis]
MGEPQSSNLGLTAAEIQVIASDLTRLRLRVDLQLAPVYPHFAGKAYPLGRCKEIRDGVYRELLAQIAAPEWPGLALIKQSLDRGAVLKKAWGSLRDEYFQSAMLLDLWYIDVANDTVHPHKPKVEILPLAGSGFAAITSFGQFVKIARAYWEVDIYRNEVCPALAPLLPLLCVGKNNASWLAAANDDMLALAMESRFTVSEAILADLPPPPESIAARWKRALQPLTANDFLHCGGGALEYCQDYRTKGCYFDMTFRDLAVHAYLQLPKVI